MAVNPPSQLRQDLDTRLDAVRSRVRIAWTRPQSWHLTLMFLGEWPAERLPGLGAALRTAVGGHRPFVVRPGGVGAFPDLQRPRVLFLHLGNDDPSGGGDPLAQLAADVRRAVDASWREGPQDHKPFRPHLTLARVKRPPAAGELAALRSLELGTFPGFEVATVELMASELRREGARYSVMETLRLAG